MTRRASETPVKYCAACGTKLERKRFRSALEDLAIFKRRKYCDRGCMAKGQEKTVCLNHKHSREKAHATVKDSCEICGGGGRLHVHHKDENPTNNSPDNLQTLCPSCHRLAHSPNYMGSPEIRRPCKYCSKPSAVGGLCYTHKTRKRKYGNPMAKKIKIGKEWVLKIEDG